jgi:tRNA pseudouridine(38-40) synthase
MILSLYAIVLLTTNTIKYWEQRLNVRCIPFFCLGRHASYYTTSDSNNVDDKIQSFWNDHPFQLAHGIVRSVLTNDNVSTSGQLVQLVPNTNSDAVFSNFYDGKLLASFGSNFRTFTNNTSIHGRRKKKSFCLVLAYVGHYFCGWQRQPQNIKLPAVQEVIENAVEHAFVENGRPDIRVSGRTDSGVHALGQIARVRILAQHTVNDSYTVITANDVFNALNIAALESNYTWRCLSVVTAPDKFHPTFDTRSRSYVYALDAKAVFELMVTILSKDVQSDREASQDRMLVTFQNVLNSQLKNLVGKELDYYSLSYGKVKTESTLCCLEHAQVVIGKAVQSDNPDQSMLIFEFTGNRFLRRMVRMLVGTCMHHALLRIENMTPIDFDLNYLPNEDTVLFDLCHSRMRTRSVKVAPPYGLIFIGANLTI